MACDGNSNIYFFLSHKERTYPVDCVKLLRGSCMRECWQDVENTDRSQQQRGHDPPCNYSKIPGSMCGCVPCCRVFLTSTSSQAIFCPHSSLCRLRCCSLFLSLTPCPAKLDFLPRTPPAPLFLTQTFSSQDLAWKSHAAEKKWV